MERRPLKSVRSLSTSKPILQSKDGIKIKEWNSATEAARHYKVNHKCIWQAINRNSNQLWRGFTWSYIVYEDLPGEIWKSHPDHKIQVSNLGRYRRNTCNVKTYGTLNAEGYRVCTLRTYGAKKNFCIHRIVLETFVGPADGRFVDHIDGNKQNNLLTNLEWVTASENAKRSHEMWKKTYLQLMGTTKD
jgi:hypothetical protein